MANAWHWYTGLMPTAQRCEHCQRRFTYGDGAIVVWTDAKLYHLSCLLDRLGTAGGWYGGCP